MQLDHKGVMRPKNLNARFFVRCKQEEKDLFEQAIGVLRLEDEDASLSKLARQLLTKECRRILRDHSPSASPVEPKAVKGTRKDESD